MEKNVKTERARRLGKKQTNKQKQTNKKLKHDRGQERGLKGQRYPTAGNAMEQTAQNWQNKGFNFLSVSSVTFGFGQGHQNRCESAEAYGSYDRTEF